MQLNHQRPGIFCLLSLRFMHMKATHNYLYRGIHDIGANDKKIVVMNTVIVKD